MPVMVVGVDNVVGARAARLLASGAGETRVFVPVQSTVDPRSFRELGCKVAHGELTDEAHVETALEQVHTVLLLLGRPTDEPGPHIEQAATVIGGAIGAGCRRLVVASDLAVAEPRGNPWLQALTEVEELAADAPLESVVLRTALTYGHHDPLTQAIVAGAARSAARGRHWPIAAEDVALTAVTADADRTLDTSLHVVVAVAGPEPLTVAEFAAALEGRVPPDPADLPAHALDLLSREVDRPTEALGMSAAPVSDLPSLPT